MSKLGTRTKSSSSSGGASGHASISTSSSPLTAGTSLPVSGSGRIAIVPPVDTTTTVDTDRPTYFFVSSAACATSRLPPTSSPNSSSTRCTGAPWKRIRSVITTRTTKIRNSVTAVVPAPSA